MSSAMNLTDEQKAALSTLPVGSTVVRLADEHPEPFLVRIPRCPIQEGSVSDNQIRKRMAGCSSDSSPNSIRQTTVKVIPPVPVHDNNKYIQRESVKTHPPSPRESGVSSTDSSPDSEPDPPLEKLSRDAIRFLADVAARPLSTTVSRYQRLNLSRRRGNAIRSDLLDAGLIDPVAIATRSGQVVLYQLADHGRTVCSSIGIDAGPKQRTSVEHSYWMRKAAEHFEAKGYEVTREYAVAGNGTIDLLAERPGERVSIEIETGKSNIKENIKKLRNADFDRIVLVATSPMGVSACQKAVDAVGQGVKPAVERLTWLDVS